MKNIWIGFSVVCRSWMCGKAIADKLNDYFIENGPKLSIDTANKIQFNLYLTPPVKPRSIDTNLNDIEKSKSQA